MPPKRASSRGERSRAAANDSGGGERSWAHDQAVSLLNDAKLSGDASGKCAKLKELAELVLRKEPELLGEFLEPMLEMRVDPNATVRKTIATLCEQIAVAHSSHLAACVSAARGLLGDAAPVVVKTATKAATAIFREALIESAMRGEGPRVPKEIKQTWKSARALVDDAKGLVLDEKTNDGVRLQAVKFLETVILLYHGRDWGSGVVSHGHATIDLDALGAEADGIVGVLLESLKPDVCAKQAGTVTLVMIGVAANVSAKLPVYFDFVLPSLVELAEANAGTDTANAASTAKELRNALLAALRSGASEVDAHESSLTTTLRDVLGAGDEVDAWRRQAERAAAKKREREQRAEELEAKRRRAADERDGASNGGGDVGGGGGGARVLDQVAQTVATLAATDRAALDAFVAQLPPDLLADVVLANLANLRHVGGRVAIDVRAGMDAGAEGFVDWAVDTHERAHERVDGERDGDGDGSGDGDDEGEGGPSGDPMDLDRDDGDDGLGLGAPVAPRAPAPPFQLKVRAFTGAARRGHISAALARIVQAADPNGAVASMGGATLQAALMARLATSSVASTTAAEGATATGPVGGAGVAEASGSAALLRSNSGVDGVEGVPARRSEDANVAGELLEYLIGALPDPVAHGAAIRLLGAMFVNEAMAGDSDARGAAAGGAYARTLMTLAVGLAESDSVARAKHLPALLLDAPAIPPPTLRLLRAMCRLPLPEGRETEYGFGVVDAKTGAASWGGEPLPVSDDAATLALGALKDLILERPTARAAALEIVLEAAVHADEDVRGRAIRLVATKLHPTATLTSGVEAFARYHLGEAAGAGREKLAEAKALAKKAAEAMRKAAAKKKAEEKAAAAKAAALRAEAEGRSAPATDRAEAEDGSGDDDEDDDAKDVEEQEVAARVETAAIASAVAVVARHLLLFCALCARKRELLADLFRAYADLPPELRPALLDGAASFDGLVRSVGPTCAPLVAAIANPPKGAESLARRAVETLANAQWEAADAAAAAAAEAAAAGDGAPPPPPPPPAKVPAALVAATETLAASDGDDVTYLIPVLGSLAADRVRSLVPKLVALPADHFRAALDRLTLSQRPAPLSASEILIALHDVDPARDGVPLKRIIDSCGECFERPEIFTAEALAAAMQKMVEMTPLPLLFMRTVIQAEAAAPTLKEFTLGLLRTLARRQVWKMDPKIWEGFMRCAKRATPRSFPVLCEMPAAAMREMLQKFPALKEPLRAYAAAPAVSASVPRAIKDALAA